MKQKKKTETKENYSYKMHLNCIDVVAVIVVDVEAEKNATKRETRKNCYGFSLTEHFGGSRDEHADCIGCSIVCDR